MNEIMSNNMDDIIMHIDDEHDGKYYVIYHNRCSDGFMAAWIAREYYTWCGIDAEYIPTNPGVTPHIPELKNSNIIMFDVVIPEEDLLEWKKQCNSLFVFDHHESAYKKLEHLKFVHFNLEKCGTSLSWAFFSGGYESNEPWYVKYTEERDTGKLYREPENCLPNSAEINAYLINIPLDFESYDKFLKNVSKEKAIEAGRHILNAQKAQLEWILKGKGRITISFPISIWEDVPIINSCILQSELGNMLAQEATDELGEDYFAIVWYMRYDEKYGPVAQVSLRSIGTMNVARLAESIIQPTGQSGGGHPRASGFFVPMRTWQRMIGV